MQLDETKFYLEVSASRKFQNKTQFTQVLNRILKESTKSPVIIAESDKTIGLIAKQYADNRDIPILFVHPNAETAHDRYKKIQHFLSQAPHHACLYFWDGKSVGTKKRIQMAVRYNARTYVYHYKNNQMTITDYLENVQD